MEEQINELIKEFEFLTYEKIEYPFFDEGDPERYYYQISGFKGNDNIAFMISSEERYQKLKDCLENDFEFINQFLGIKLADKYEIGLTSINSRTHSIGRRSLKDEPVEIELDYYKNNLKIQIQFKPENSTLTNLMEMKRRYGVHFVMTIDGLVKQREEDITVDLRNIINSTLFDFAYNYNIYLEPINIEDLDKRRPLRRRNKTSIPDEAIKFIYKKYIPELIEYFNIGEKVEYLPFKFICYFHIIEYFSDKSAYYAASKKLKGLLMKPDFHINSDKYINQAINFFKIEATKNTSDKIKIRRVITQFIDKDEFEDYLNDIGLLEYFSEDVTIDCSKPLILSGVNFESTSKFQESLMKRIYSMRCSIVHSNPDFDESKAIPFTPTSQNMDILKKEIDLIYEVARTIIIESRE